MLHILIPMAGLGSRFARAGHTMPKPLIAVHGVPMIRLVIDNLRPRRPHRFVFVIQRDHDVAYGVAGSLAGWAPGCGIVAIDGQTEGAACTALAAAGMCETDDALMIANADQFVETDIDAYLDDMDRRRLDGLIMTMPACDPKWSYAACDAQGMVVRVAEKQVIAPDATVGIYAFARGRDFVRAARRMIADGRRSAGEYYVAPVYNELIEGGARIGVHGIAAEAMHGLGIPGDLDAFLARPISRHWADGRV